VLGNVIAGIPEPPIPAPPPSFKTDLIFLGADATDAFEDIGHSPSARDMLKKYYIGDLEGPVPDRSKLSKVGRDPVKSSDSGISVYIVPVIIMAAIAFLVQRFM
jgi:cytochrome b involved in lipid metabolism